jgi:phosphate uptake regulator
MELRKVQRTSSGTFFVCLPKEWAERSGLDRGSVISVSEASNGRLIIDAKYDVEPGQRIAVIKSTSHLDREIIEKYLLGYDIIQIEAKEKISLSDRERVKQTSSRLVGLEIIEENYSKIVMQCLLELSAFPPERILRREYSIASGMHRDAVTALIEGDVHLAKNVIARDNEVDRLYFLLVRILRTVIQNPRLSEKLGILPIGCLDYRLAASLVESIGDRSTQIAEKCIQLAGEKIAEELSQLILKLHGIVYASHENALKAMFTHDVSLAQSVRAEREKITMLIQEVEKAVRSQPVEFAPCILAIISLMSRIYDHSVDIADLVMPKPA